MQPNSCAYCLYLNLILVIFEFILQFSIDTEQKHARMHTHIYKPGIFLLVYLFLFVSLVLFLFICFEFVRFVYLFACLFAKQADTSFTELKLWSSFSQWCTNTQAHLSDPRSRYLQSWCAEQWPEGEKTVDVTTHLHVLLTFGSISVHKISFLPS